MASIMDVLAPSRVPDTEGVRRRGPADLEASIRHDIQLLLNTRRPPSELTDGFTHLPGSILNYGLRDFAFSKMESEQRQEAARHIEEILTRFEPRLTAIRVEPLEPEPGRTLVRFNIFARIRGPNGEMESDFRNSFEWTTGHHEVSNS